MTTDGEQPVQPEQASQEPVQTEGEASQEGAAQPTAEDTAKAAEAKMADLVAKMVANEVKKATETSKREIQSVKDRARAEVDSAAKRAHLAESSLSATKQAMSRLDPEAAQELELAELRAREMTATDVRKMEFRDRECFTTNDFGEVVEISDGNCR